MGKLYNHEEQEKVLLSHAGLYGGNKVQEQKLCDEQKAWRRKYASVRAICCGSPQAQLWIWVEISVR